MKERFTIGGIPIISKTNYGMAVSLAVCIKLAPYQVGLKPKRLRWSGLAVLANKLKIKAWLGLALKRFGYPIFGSDEN